MFTQKHLLFFSLAAALLGGCSDGNGAGMTGKQARLAVENCSTRPASGNMQKLEDDFALVLLTETGTAYAGVRNPVRAVYQSGNWDLPEIWLTEIPGRLHAFHPYGEYLQKDTLTLDLSTQTDYLASETGGMGIDYRQPRIENIELHHLLARVEVSLEGSTECSLSIADYPSMAQYSLVSGSLKTGGTESLLSSPSSALLVFPGDIKDYKALIAYGGRQYGYFFPENMLEAGKSYHYKLTISKEGLLELSGVTVSPWLPGGDYEVPVRPEPNNE